MERKGKECWEHFHHVADIGVRGYGVSLEDAFACAAMALSAVIAPLDVVEPRERVTIEVRSADLEILLVEWLDALIYEMAVRHMLFSRFDLHIRAEDGGFRLAATAWGEPVDRDRHQPAVEVKGATLTALKVEETPQGLWVAQCVVDV